MIGTIELMNMEFYAYHGCFDEERTIGNYFLVDLWIDVDMKHCSKSDDIYDAFNYVIAYEIVKNEMELPSNLLEHVAGRILQSLFDATNAIRNAKVRVSKLNPPIGSKVERVSVVLSKSR